MVAATHQRPKKTKAKKAVTAKPAPNISDFRAMSEFGKVPQVAKILNVSRQTVYKLINAEQLPAVLVADCVRVRWDDVERFIASGGSKKSPA